MWKDPIVEEVRRVRDGVAASCGYDLHVLVSFLRDKERAAEGKVITPPKGRASRAKTPRARKSGTARSG